MTSVAMLVIFVLPAYMPMYGVLPALFHGL